jgi:hypothetical protein
MNNSPAKLNAAFEGSSMLGNPPPKWVRKIKFNAFQRQNKRLNKKSSKPSHATKKGPKKGSLGYDKIAKSANRNTLDGDLSWRERRKGDAHTGCPSFKFNKKTGEKVCTTGGGKSNTSDATESKTIDGVEITVVGNDGDQTEGKFTWPKIDFGKISSRIKRNKKENFNTNTTIGWNPSTTNTSNFDWTR